MITALAEVTGYCDGYLTVRCQQKTSCGSCASKSQCGTGIVSNALPGKILDIRIASRASVPTGSVVEIGLEEQIVLKSAIIVYVMPLLLAIAGAFFGQFLSTLMAVGEGIVILSSLLFGCIGMVLARHFSRRLEQDTEVAPTLIRVLGAPVADTAMINAATDDSD